MERAERIVVLCVGLAFSFVLIPVLWVMLGLTTVTAGQRFVKVWRQANRAGYGPPPRRAAGVRPRGARTTTSSAGPLALSARWRAWREANGWVPRPAALHRRLQAGRCQRRWHERRQAGWPD